MKKGQEWTKGTKETEQEEKKKQMTKRRQNWPKGEKETEQERLGGLETHSQAYSAFLQSSTVPPSLADDIHRLEAAQRVDCEDMIAQ